jgi:hypothetical protein
MKKFILGIIMLSMVSVGGCSTLLPMSPTQEAEITAQNALNYYETVKKESLSAYLNDKITLEQYKSIRAILCVYKSRHEQSLDTFMIDKNLVDLKASIEKAENDLKKSVGEVYNVHN